jgi:hypothetical protein
LNESTTSFEAQKTQQNKTKQNKNVCSPILAGSMQRGLASFITLIGIFSTSQKLSQPSDFAVKSGIRHLVVLPFFNVLKNLDRSTNLSADSKQSQMRMVKSEDFAFNWN